MTCNLIVHGDDFGLTEKVNEGILKAHQHGILTSTSLMANGAAFEHATNICQTAPTLDVGIHLTLVEEEPILEADTLPTLTTPGGKFHHHANDFVKKFLLGRICQEEVRRELEAQISRIINKGIRVSHMDSHQHLHMLPGIRPIVMNLARKYNIKAIRIPSERLDAYMLNEIGCLSRIPQLLALKWLSLIKRNSAIIHTDHFLGFFYAGKLNKANLKKILQHLPKTGTCELMCHPGCDDQNSQYRHWRYHWSDELNALSDKEVIDTIKRNKIQLTSYGQLINLNV